MRNRNLLQSYPGFPPVETSRPAPPVSTSGNTQCYASGNLLYCLAINGVPSFFTCCLASAPPPPQLPRCALARDARCAILLACWSCRDTAGRALCLPREADGPVRCPRRRSRAEHWPLMRAAPSSLLEF